MPAAIFASLASVAVVGCSGSGFSGAPGPAVVTYHEGLPPGQTASLGSAPGLPPPLATWRGPHLMYITAWGSSGCPQLPTSVHLATPDQLTVTTGVFNNTPGSDACADDLVPDTSTIKVPNGLDTTKPVVVRIDHTTVTLAPPR
jgi:hypothetical protein